MITFILVALALTAATAFVVWAIAKLPSRYERRPRNLSPWNSLDEGIDPTIDEGREE